MDRRTFIQHTTLMGAAVGATVTHAKSSLAMEPPQSAPLRLAEAPLVELKTLDIKSIAEQLQSVAPMSTLNAGDVAPSLDEIPEILQPIDVGAEKLLTEYKNSVLSYSPMEVEYLVNTLDDHITNCLNLREKAQQLESLAVAQRLELKLERKNLEFLAAVAQLDRDSAGHISSAMYDPTISGNSLKSSDSPSAMNFFDQKQKIERNGIAAREEIANIKLSEMKKAGGGNNNVERFQFIKELFNVELVEAYRRARSISVGLKYVYSMDVPVPNISDVGFLNKLCLWHKKVFYMLERHLMRTTTSTVLVGLRKGADAANLQGLLSDADFVAQRNASVFKFTLPANFFDQPTLKLKNPRLRGFEMFVWNDAVPKPIEFMRALATLPDQTIRSDGQVIWANNLNVTVPIISVPQGTEFSFQNRREVHNVGPAGDWVIQLDKKTLTDKDTTKDDVLKNLFLVLRISSEV